MFWDSSAVVPLLLHEERSLVLLAMLEADPEPAIWWCTPVECQSALARSVRDRSATQDEAGKAAERLRRARLEIDEITPTEDIRVRAMRLLSLYRLRAADALQLAAALHWCEEQAAGETFVCLDRHLAEAARREGFTVLPE